MAMAAAPIEANIQSLLGDDQYATYKYFQETLPIRIGIVLTLNVQYLPTDSAISPVQTEQLISMIRDANPANDSQSQILIPDSVLQQAQALLSPTQLAALAQMAEQHAADAKAIEAAVAAYNSNG